MAFVEKAPATEPDATSRDLRPMLYRLSKSDHPINGICMGMIMSLDGILKVHGVFREGEVIFTNNYIWYGPLWNERCGSSIMLSGGDLSHWRES